MLAVELAHATRYPAGLRRVTFEYAKGARAATVCLERTWFAPVADGAYDIRRVLAAIDVAARYNVVV